ncbi:MAG TPA: amidase [Thermoanaerobaculia bacterium]|nr:amidase [Thermoanaerobaculia bacterium]
MKRRTFLRNTVALAGGALWVPDAVVAGGYGQDGGGDPVATELWRMSARELGALVARRKVSVREVVEAHARRIQGVNPSVNAITPLLEGSLADADARDALLASGAGVGPLFGVPFSVKANIDVEGSATTEGVRSLAGNVVDVDSPHVGMLRRAGAIPVARGNMPDFGLRFHTDSDLYGPTINPWNRALTPGGSSGGDAVAVATGMVPLGLGNDFGGSIRYPAQCCGVCGLRPSRGRIASATRATSQGSISHSLRAMAVQGALARRVDDLRAALQIMSAFDPRDPHWVPAPMESEPRRPLRIALVSDPAGLGVDDSVRTGVRRAAAILEGHGGIIEEIDSSSLDESAHLWLEMVATDIRRLFLAGINERASAAARTFVSEMIRLSGEGSLDGYVHSLARINGIAQSWGDSFQKYDAILGPVSSRNPFPVGFDVAGPDSARSVLESQVLTVTVNLLGLPSVAVPVGVSGGIPQAVQIIGPMFQEMRILDLAELIEREVGAFTPIDPKAGAE